MFTSKKNKKVLAFDFCRFCVVKLS